MSVEITIDVAQALRNLSSLDRTVRNRIVRRAARAGAKPLVAEARNQAPRRTGALRSSIRVTKVKLNRARGLVYAVIRPRSTARAKQKGRDAWYSHIVIGGAAETHIGTSRTTTTAGRDRPRKHEGKTLKLPDGAFRRTVTIPKRRGNDFMTRAAMIAGRRSIDEFSRVFRETVEAEVRKLPK